MITDYNTKSNNLTFFGTDPGAVKFGNFINYYSFHDVHLRTSNLHSQMFPKPLDNDIVCLDIGCNTGNLTKQLYEYLKTTYTECNIYMLAIDIDPTLVERAQESNDCPSVTYIPANIMTVNDRKLLTNYLDSHGKKVFDITFCFSVTMWIHLNNGDEGLKEFLKYIAAVSRSIIIEPQPWHCYRNAQRRVKKSGSSFDLYETIKIRSNVDSVIENIIMEHCFRKKYESPNSSWNRKIQSYHKTD